MTVVVADSSPLNYLTLIGSIEVLHRLYGTVIVPRQVIAELIDPAAPENVRKWASDLPRWITLRETVVSGDEMAHLDPGERAAIVLAQSEPGALLLIDETAGRIEASRRGIRNTGTLGILRAAALKGYVELPTALARLLDTNFRVNRRCEVLPASAAILRSGSNWHVAALIDSVDVLYRLYGNSRCPAAGHRRVERFRYSSGGCALGVTSPRLG